MTQIAVIKEVIIICNFQLPTYILSNTFDRNYHNRRVYLGGNRLTCNCSVAQVVKVWLLSNKKHISDYDQVLCDNAGEKVRLLLKWAG